LPAAIQPVYYLLQ